MKAALAITSRGTNSHLSFLTPGAHFDVQGLLCRTFGEWGSWRIYGT